MKKLLIALAIALITASGAQATIIVDNYFTEPNGATSGAVANLDVQTFTPNVAGLGVLDTVAANSPLPATVFLKSASFLSAVSGTPQSTGPAYIDVWQGSGTTGTYLGSSTNAHEILVSDPSTEYTWLFPNIALDSTMEHGLVFADSPGDSALAAKSVRVAVARDAGGAFGNSYSGGSADLGGPPSGAIVTPFPFDMRFRVEMVVPEPSTIAFAGLGLFGAITMRRRRMAVCC